MTKNRSRKQRTRQRMESTGESFVQASSRMEKAHQLSILDEFLVEMPKPELRFISLAPGTKVDLPGISPVPGHEPFEIVLKIRGRAEDIPLITELFALQDPEQDVSKDRQSIQSVSGPSQRIFLSQARATGSSVEITVRYRPIEVEVVPGHFVQYIALAPGTRFHLPGLSIPEDYEPFELQLRVSGDPDEIPMLAHILELQDPSQPQLNYPLASRSSDDAFQRHEISQGKSKLEMVVRSTPTKSYPSEALVEDVLDGKVSLDELLKHWPEDRPNQADPDDSSARGELLQIVEKWILPNLWVTTDSESYSLDLGWHYLEEWLAKPKAVTTVFNSSTYPNPDCSVEAHVEHWPSLQPLPWDSSSA